MESKYLPDYAFFDEKYVSILSAYFKREKLNISYEFDPTDFEISDCIASETLPELFVNPALSRADGNAIAAILHTLRGFIISEWKTLTPVHPDGNLPIGVSIRRKRGTDLFIVEAHW